MAETKDKLITAESLKYVHDSLSEKIVDIKATVSSQTPLFANNLDECVDTTKLYVLPDGYIYAYMMSKQTISADVNALDDVGFENDLRLSSSTYTEVHNDGTYLTGFIQANVGDKLTLHNITIPADSTEGYGNFYYLFDENQSGVGFGRFLTSISGMNIETDDSGNVINFTIYKSGVSSCSYIRICANGISEDSSIIVNAGKTTEIVAYQWTNTGHMFIQSGYEDRIIAVEKNVAQNTEAIAMLNGVADYVIEEAERVAKATYEKQNANTISFLAISDAHYLVGHTNIENGLLHAGQGMNLIRKGVHIDFAAVLGDNGCGSGVVGSSNRATIEMGINEIQNTNKCIDDGLRGIQNLRVPGNHDSLIYNYTFNNNSYLDANKLFPLYGAYNIGATFQSGQRDRGYCYCDFEEQKIRVIALNTSDIKDLNVSDSTRPIYISSTQIKWFMETIDLSTKADAANWNILILSHAPLDWGLGCIYICDILKAYLDGTSISIKTVGDNDSVTISYDYTGKNAATIIGNCHGHNHNFKVDNLRKLVSGSTSVTEAINIKRFCIPNACFERTNERGENGMESGSDGVFDIEYGEETSYEKVAGTAQDTAFCVVTIDPIARKIYANFYGAGYDREISY